MYPGCFTHWKRQMYFQFWHLFFPLPWPCSSTVTLHLLFRLLLSTFCCLTPEVCPLRHSVFYFLTQNSPTQTHIHTSLPPWVYPFNPSRPLSDKLPEAIFSGMQYLSMSIFHINTCLYLYLQLYTCPYVSV